MLYLPDLPACSGLFPGRIEKNADRKEEEKWNIRLQAKSRRNYFTFLRRSARSREAREMRRGSATTLSDSQKTEVSGYTRMRHIMLSLKREEARARKIKLRSCSRDTLIWYAINAPVWSMILRRMASDWW